MGLHKLTAGDGYTYLTRQVAAHDRAERGPLSLSEYYAEKGESPGRWCGSALPDLGLAEGDMVHEEQMRSLFGAGRHPDAARLAAAVLDRGGTAVQAREAGALGRPFTVRPGASPFAIEVAQAFSDYNRSLGLRWNTHIPVDERARIRTEIATRQFTETEGRPPTGARELAGFIARASRQATRGVAGFDLTFSPVKSVSTLWAIAPPEIARAIEAAHHAAVADTLAWLEREVAFTRMSVGGVRQVPVTGLIGAAFTHRDSRAGDPDLHTHVAISNKVRSIEAFGSRWLALDGRVLFKAKVTASERYNTRLEAELAARLGVAFVAREVPGKRPIREIDGVDPRLAQYWSSRRSAINLRRGELAAAFQADHGRPPTAVEALALAQQANLETRQAKHAPRAEADQRQAWAREAEELLGSAANVTSMGRASLGRRTPIPEVTDRQVTEVAATVVEILEGNRATWQIWHVQAEAERQARTLGVPRDQLDTTIDRIVDHVLTLDSTRLDPEDPAQEPAALRHPGGRSVYDIKGSARYTSRRILEAEQTILTLAQTHGGCTLAPVRVDVALAHAEAQGRPLNDAQATLVQALLTSDAKVQLALAPAGTGKTTTMRVLADAWTRADGWVLGLAPSAQAAHELRDALTDPEPTGPDDSAPSSMGSTTDTLAKLVWSLENEPENERPDWVRAVDATCLVVIDEAGQAGSVELATACEYLTGRGASVRLLGDDQQLASVTAGGILRDLSHQVGAVTLAEVRRFVDPAEAAATLAVRAGDVGALGYYADHDRIHVGDLTACADQAYRAWAGDRAHGQDSLLLAPSRDLVTTLNARARLDRLATTPGGPRAATEVELGDGCRVSAGDVIVTRRNNRRLTVSNTDWVKNGDRWTVLTAHEDGSLTVRGNTHRRRLTLPAAYVATDVQLGYASTVHAAQGMTVDTCHTVLSGQEPRQLAYVALSRGRIANHVYLAEAHDGDPHSLARPETLRPPTALDILSAVLHRDGSQHSAISTAREAASAFGQLHDAALRYHDALGFAAEQVLGTDGLAGIDTAADELSPGIRKQGAYPTLRGHLAVLAADGADVASLLADALGEREVNTAGDLSAVLDWRLPTPGFGPLPWLAAVPARVADHPDWGAYLAHRAKRITDLADAVHRETHTWEPARRPAWARDLGDDIQPDVVAHLAVWRAAFAIPDDDLRPTGGPQPAATAEQARRALLRRLPRDRRRDHPVDLPTVLEADPRRHLLNDRLTALRRADVDVDQLVATALAEPRPLPHDVPADALWFRIAGHLGPAVLRATTTQTAHCRPAWASTLTTLLDPTTAARVEADPAWPALVAAVNAASSEWTPDHLLTSVLEGSHTQSLEARDLCEALVWRVALLTETPPVEEPEPLAPRAAIEQPANPRPPASRLHELNRLAAAYYASLYDRSWAAAYLHDRLGTDLRSDTPHEVGYAPPGPTSLLRHLTNLGASDHELTAAGLVRQTDRGTLIDCFRDRVVFPIRDGDQIAGFIGRRNPTRDSDENAGPKYLNTRATDVFTKGHLLFGWDENRAVVNAGASIVLVEGPLDALAVTLACDGKAIGVAVLGTEFTEDQAALLRPAIHQLPDRVVIATDGDDAGWAAAQRDYWLLTSAGASPRLLEGLDQLDPAEFSQLLGARHLAAKIQRARPAAVALLDGITARYRANEGQSAARLRAVAAAGTVIGALPPNDWKQHLAKASRDLGLPAGMLELEVIDASAAWTPVLAHRHDLPSPERVRRTGVSPAASARDQVGPVRTRALSMPRVSRSTGVRR